MTTASRPGSERLPRERARRDPDESWLVPVLVALVASLLLHAVGFPAFMGLVDRLGWLQPVAAIPPPPEPVDMDIVVPEPEPEPEVVEPEPEPEVEPPPPPPEARPPRNPSPEPPPPPQEEPPPPEPEPVDFTGLTLTSEGSGGGFAVQASDGTDRRGPLGPPPTRARRGAPGGEEGGTGGGGTGEGSGPRIVPSSDLSRQPRPPNTSAIAQCMQDNYPRQARNQGVEGVARVRIQINPNGAVSNLRVRSESVSSQGFGRACMQCLRGRRWSPPLDRNGNPVATRVTYSCTFTVRQ